MKQVRGGAGRRRGGRAGAAWSTTIALDWDKHLRPPRLVADSNKQNLALTDVHQKIHVAEQLSALQSMQKLEKSEPALPQAYQSTVPICPITHRAGVHRYDAYAREEVIADYLVEQFSPNPPRVARGRHSPPLEEHYTQVEKRIHKFMATPPNPRRGLISMSSRATQNSIRM
ncbi:hypothetical protein EVAR_31326_1 [Eumeta japonica]|uniref:Uncharacterized protein n=1 Tax=Eumeta variegata TaxID=151549 RepID=A0A4C1XXM1_EUMVA|nr:hypothetical protein EVAR_31326_1 [Eumeta japonica]